LEKIAMKEITPMILPDSTIEVAARAMAEMTLGDASLYDKYTGAGKAHWTDLATAALTAALPSIVEECAKVADEICLGWTETNHTGAAIRSLLTTPDSAPSQKEPG
jgi:hypothetical protein